MFIHGLTSLSYSHLGDTICQPTLTKLTYVVQPTQGNYQYPTDDPFGPSPRPLDRPLDRDEPSPRPPRPGYVFFYNIIQCSVWYVSWI